MPIPRDDASELEWLLFSQSRVITWPQATRLLTPAKVRHLVATGRWRRLSRGVLVTSPGRLEPAQQWWAAVLAAGPDAVLAGLAAARAGGLRRVRSQRGDAVDILVPAARQAPDLLRRMPIDMPAVFVRRTRYLPASDRQRARPTRTPSNGPWWTQRSGQ